MTQKKKVYLMGCGGHAKVVLRTLQDLGYDIDAIFDDQSATWGTTVLGIPVIGPLKQIVDSPARPTVITIGNNSTRHIVSQQFDLEWLTVVDPRASVDLTARVGLGTVILRGAMIQVDAHIGQHVIINTSASVDHDCVIGDHAHVGPGAHLAGNVVIGKGTLLGTGSSTIPRVAVGDWSTVGAGSVVVSDLPSNVVAVGVPARVANSRSNREIGRDVSGCPAVPIPIECQSLTHPETRDTPAESSSAAAVDRIYLSPPHMSRKSRELLLDAFDSNWIAPLGPHVDALEREFAEKLGVQHAVAVSSGTAALHLALLVLGVGAGDKVATATLTFAATANAICYVGGTPVFIDSQRSTWNLDPDLLALELEAGVQRGHPLKAVVAVDICGQCADYEPIRDLCRFYEIPLIEDAAEALGATYGGRAAGTFGDIACFSFNGNKIITTSGGGMLVTRNKAWADKARYLASQARDPFPHYEHSEVGYNYRLSNLLAAIGRAQLEVLDDFVDKRRANFSFYEQTLADLPGISFMPELPDSRSTRWLTCITVDPDQFGATREDIRLALERENIESRAVWKPMHQQPAYLACHVRGGEVAEELFQRGLCLPSGSSLNQADLTRIVGVIRDVHKPAKSALPLMGVLQ